MRINAGVCEFTYLIRKHVAGDLVGNDVRIVGEDVVQNRAVILSWNQMKRKVSRRPRSRVTLDLLPQAENSSPPEVKRYLM